MVGLRDNRILQNALEPALRRIDLDPLAPNKRNRLITLPGRCERVLGSAPRGLRARIAMTLAQEASGFLKLKWAQEVSFLLSSLNQGLRIAILLSVFLLNMSDAGGAALGQPDASCLESLPRIPTNEISVRVDSMIRSLPSLISGLSSEDVARYLDVHGGPIATNRKWFELSSRIRLDGAWPDLLSHRPIPPTQLKQFRALLRINRDVLNTVKTLTEGVRQPMFCRMSPSECYGGQKEPTSGIMKLPYCLFLDAAVSCQDGKLPPALASIQGILAFARDLLMEDSPNCHFAARRSVRLARFSLERVIESGLIDQSGLITILNSLEGIQTTGMVHRALFWELCASRYDRSAIHSNGPDNSDLRWWQMTGPSLHVNPLLSVLSWGFYVCGMDGFIRANLEQGGVSSHNFEVVMQQFRKQLPFDSNSSVAVSIAEAQAGYAIMNLAELETDVQIMKLVLMVERCRIATGHLPTVQGSPFSWERREMIVDSFNRLPLRYRVMPRGYLIYSLGPDGIDQSSNTPPENIKPMGSFATERIFQGNDDVLFRVQ